MRLWPVAMIALLVVTAAPATAKDKGPNPWCPVEPVRVGERLQRDYAGFSILLAEKEILRNYYRERPVECLRGKKAKDLPPGLRKKVRRGGELPPGWQRKVARGEVLSDDLYRYSTPLPPDLLSRLPHPPPGTRLLNIDGTFLRVMDETRVILDIFDLVVPRR